VIGGVTGSFIAHRLEKKRREREALHEGKRVAVSRMLDVLDTAIRLQALPPFVRSWRSPNMAPLLALSRLTLDLTDEDLPISVWAAGQVQRMAYERTGKSYLRRATELQARLVSWYRGDLNTHWFIHALEEEPFEEDWRPTRLERTKTNMREALANVGYITAAAFSFSVFRDALMPFVARFVRGTFARD
jgi:hypothetical protein